MAEPVAIFKQLGSIPQYTKLNEINLIENRLQLVLSSSSRDFARKEKVSLLSTIEYSFSTETATKSFPIEIESNVGLISKSPSGRFQVRLRTFDKKLFVEVHGSSTFQSIDVSKVHGPFYNDDYFGIISWSQDETKIIYVAEPVVPEDDSRFDYEPDSGEGYTGRGKACIVILDITNGIKTDPIILKDMPFFGVSRPFFSPCGQEIYFIGIEKEPLRLGIKFCVNRRTGLYKSNLDGSSVLRLNDANLNARYPVLSPDNTMICYLSHPFGGPHNSCAQLNAYSIETKRESVLVPVVKTASKYSTFPGLFVNSIDENCWIRGDKDDFLLLSSSWRSRTVILAIGIKLRTVSNLNTKGLESWSLLGCSSKGHCVALKSDFANMPQIVAAEFGSLENDLNWKVIYQPDLPKGSSKLIEISDLLTDIEYSISSVDGRSPNLEVILINNTQKVSKNGKSPLIVMPHGGPHGALNTAYNLTIAGLTSFGFACLLVNYSGSTGFGDDSIYSLVGNIGSLDIDDTHCAAIWASKEPIIDSKNIFLNGGSHGGYITAHLVAREPNFYRGGILRNPVINIGEMVGNSDIPDWCFGEAGMKFDSRSPDFVKGDQYTEMLKISPISHIGEKVSPVLLFIGLCDRRVPPSQGFRWAEYLKGKNHSISVLKFPKDAHGLESFDAQKRVFEATIQFIQERLN